MRRRLSAAATPECHDVRLLVVEDEAELRRLVADALGGAGFAVDAFRLLDEADAAVGSVSYDAVVLDLGLPDGDGMTFLRRLRARERDVPVLILTARDGLADRVAGLDGGADDYLVKPFHREELIARVRALLRRPKGALGTALSAGNVTLHTADRRATVGGRALALARREIDLLEMLLRRQGRVVAKGAIEDGLYGFGEEVGSNAVEVAVHRLRRKLEGVGASVRIHTLRGLGYLLEEES